MKANALAGRVFFIFSFLLVLCVFLSFGSKSIAGDEKGQERPERAISLAFEYPGVIIDMGDSFTGDLIVKNKGKCDENLYLSVSSAPPGWKARIKTYSFSVTSIHVPGGENRTLTFSADPDNTIEQGLYEFRVDATTEDQKLQVSQNLTVDVREKEKEKGSIELTTGSYPVLRGPSDSSFEFSLDVSNKTEKEDTISLASRGPNGWQINFKPPFEDKYISSLRLKPDESKNISVEVKPDRFSGAGEYSIPVLASAGELRAEADLTVIITGTYMLEAGTATGLLSLETQQGKQSNVSIYVKNTGSAPIRNIEFLSLKPENWKVKFDPENIEALEPGSLKQIEVSILPAQDALIGDYAIGVDIRGEKSSDDLELRVTVKTSAAWGWVGIFIIVAVILGLFGLFVTLGRR